MKRKNESLRIAAEIRRKLEGRRHSDSTELLAEDRKRTRDDSLADREFVLEDLLSGVTKKNRHPEIDFGPPVGKEKC